MNDMERAKVIAENKDLSKEQRSIGVMAALMGIKNDSIIRSMVTVGDSELSAKATKKVKRFYKPKGLTETESVLHDMLKENTGCAMMDSGGDDGRHWQRNAKIKDFRELPAYSYEVSDYLEISASLFHYLNENLTYNDDVTREFTRWCTRNGAETHHHVSPEEFLEQVYGASEDDYRSGNSYDGEGLSDQVVQFTTYNDDLVFLQIHGGADIRGGYTDIKVFNMHDECFMYDTHCSLHCDCGDPYSDDSGYHWYDIPQCDEGYHDNGLPKMWKIENKKYRCTQCDKIVEVSS